MVVFMYDHKVVLFLSCTLENNLVWWHFMKLFMFNRTTSWFSWECQVNLQQNSHSNLLTSDFEKLLSSFSHIFSNIIKANISLSYYLVKNFTQWVIQVTVIKCTCIRITNIFLKQYFSGRTVTIQHQKSKIRWKYNDKSVLF